MSVVVIKRSVVYLPAALAIISDKKVDGEEDDHEEDGDHEVDDDHEVDEVHTCKWRCSGSGAPCLQRTRVVRQSELSLFINVIKFVIIKNPPLCYFLQLRHQL